MTDQTTTPQNDDATRLMMEAVDTSRAMRAYVFLGLGMPLSVLHIPVLPIIGFIMVVGATIQAYKMRALKTDDGILSAHGRWLVRTFWIGSFYGLLGMILSGVIVSLNVEPASLGAINEALSTGMADPILLQNALLAFQTKNSFVLTLASVLSVAPAGLFMLARSFKGYRLADKGQVPPRPKTWLV